MIQANRTREGRGGDMQGENDAPTQRESQKADRRERVRVTVMPRPLARNAPLVRSTMRRLLRDILNGVYGQGERIREVEVASRMGVSRAPVREAMRLLEQDGLIEFEPFRGGRVIDLEPREIRDLFELMSVLAGAVARFAVRNATDEQLARVFEDFAEFERGIQAGEPVIESVNQAYRLGTRLGQCCGNPVAAEMLARLSRVAYLYHRFVQPVPARWMQQAATRVRKFEAAVRARSEDRAEKTARRMILHTSSLVVRRATQQQAQSSTPSPAGRDVPRE